ncbi:MAG: CPBP family intramembrane metalloprotease [Candidatus Heimdallarchaeota archaeon]|nr:CPBP family intramembrane metalloprotease [Candidatus Heimdallarchaeota archaeon]
MMNENVEIPDEDFIAKEAIELQIIKKHFLGLLVFFILAFAITWVLQIPNILYSYSIISIPDWSKLVFGGLATFGPTFAAIIAIAIFEGKKNIAQMFTKGIKSKFSKIWLIPIFVLFPTIAAITFLLVLPIDGYTLAIGYYKDAGLYVGVIFLGFFIGGPLGEEFGWRGYALDKLQKRHSTLTSSIVIGIFWSLWHLPLHFIRGTTQSMIPIWVFFVITATSSIFYTWIYNNTNGSILAVILLHWIANIAVALLPYWQLGVIKNQQPDNLLIPTYGMIIGLVITLIIAIVVVANYNMTRRNLMYQIKPKYKV